MGNFFNQLSWRFASWMQGRNGNDHLGFALTVLCLVLLVASSFSGLDVLWYIALVAIILAVWRMFSRNISKRRAENEAFLRLIDRPRKAVSVAVKRFRNRKTTMYFKCEGCKTVLSVPRGKGRIKVTCPKCHRQTIRKS